jgi:hypothetical protein
MCRLRQNAPSNSRLKAAGAIDYSRKAEGQLTATGIDHFIAVFSSYSN